MSSTPKFRRDSSPSELRAPPHSREAEQAVLGGLMLDRSAWDQVGDVVTADDFFGPDHKVIFESIAALSGEAQPCDPVTVSEHLQRLGKLQEAGGLSYLGTLTRDTPGAANAILACGFLILWLSSRITMAGPPSRKATSSAARPTSR